MSRMILLNFAVLTREMRTRMRGRRAAIVITVYLLLLSGLGGMMLYFQQEQLQRSGYDIHVASDVGLQIFVTLSLFQLFLVIFIVPGLTGAAIAGERDRQTLDLLLSTQVSSLSIVLGKILSSLSYVFLLMLAALPVFSMAFLFGGVSPDQVGLVFLISLVSALTLGTIGVFLSVLIRRGQMATVLAYSVTFLLLVGTLALSVFIGMATEPTRTGNVQTVVILPLALNPLAALASAIASPFMPELPLMGTSSSYYSYYGTTSSYGQGGSWLALWHISLVVDTVLCVVFLLLAATLLRPGVPRFSLLRRRAEVER